MQTELQEVQTEPWEVQTELQEVQTEPQEVQMELQEVQHLKNYLKTRQSQVCLGTLKDAQEFGQFLGNTRLPKHPG